MDILQSLRRFINKHELLERGSTVIVGVSGGPDSLCLLHALNVLAPEYDLRLHAAHLNHQLRGEEANADAIFVKSIARQWKLPYTIESRDVAAFAQEHKLSIEEAARQVRYGFLIEVAEQERSDTIAVAHNADDQTESVLMHFLRGSGMSGLRGMLPKSEIADFRFSIANFESKIENRKSKIFIVRPLLETPRSTIEEYCQQHNLQPRIDATNADTTYFRNRLRHELLPTLETYNPNIRSILRRTASVITAEYELLEAQVNLAWDKICVEATDELITFHLANFREQLLAIRRSLLRRSIQQLRLPLRDVDFVNIEDAIELIDRGHTGDQATLPQGLMLEITYDSITIADADEIVLPDLPLLPVGTTKLLLAMPGTIKLPSSNWLIEVTYEQDFSKASEWPHITWKKDVPLGRRPNFAAYFDADALSAPLEIRTRTSTDQFHPDGMPSPVGLKDWMINVKIPRVVRDRLPLILANDQIAWVAGFRVGQPFIVHKETKRMILMTFRKVNSEE
jgi:tRNA(Ile)-lysidine synthase